MALFSPAIILRPTGVVDGGSTLFTKANPTPTDEADWGEKRPVFSVFVKLELWI
jgi:hypothetical protein